MLNLSGGPALHLTSGRSPMLSEARDVRNLGESNEQHSVSEQISDPASSSSSSTMCSDHVPDDGCLDND